MTHIEIDKKKYAIPTTWNELTTPQVERVCRLINMPISKYELKMWVLQSITRISFHKLIRINAETTVQIHELLKWLDSDVLLARNPYTFVRVWWREYVGVADGLSDMNFEQFFQWSEYYFGQYLKTQNEADLHLLIACLYTRKGKPFEPQNIKKNALWLRFLSEKKKQVILLYYIGCRNYLARRFGRVFTKSEGKPDKVDDLYFIKLLDNLNQGDASKNAALRHVALYEILTRITNAIKEADELEKLSRK